MLNVEHMQRESANLTSERLLKLSFGYLKGPFKDSLGKHPTNDNPLVFCCTESPYQSFFVIVHQYLIRGRLQYLLYLVFIYIWGVWIFERIQTHQEIWSTPIVNVELKWLGEGVYHRQAH